MRLLIDYCCRLNVWGYGYNSVPLYSYDIYIPIVCPALVPTNVSLT